VHLKHGYCMLIHFIHGYYCIYRPWQPLTYLYFPYCISLIYFSFTKIRIFLYARIYWLAEFGDVSCLHFSNLRVETLTPTWEDFVGQFGWTILSDICRTILRVKSDKTLCPTWEYDRWYTWRDLYVHLLLLGVSIQSVCNQCLSLLMLQSMVWCARHNFMW
jgi:hypothetical protein